MPLKREKIRALLFDMNGVIVDDENLHKHAFTLALEEEGVLLDQALYQEHFIGRTDRQGLENFLGKESGQDIDLLLQKKSAFYREALAGGIPAFPGIDKLIEELAALELPLALVTSANRDEALSILKGLGLSSYFSALVAAEDVSQGKPHPESYLLGASLLGQSPSDCLALEDSPSGIIAAKKAGAQVVALTNTHPENALCQADFLLQNPLHLLELL